MFTFEHSFHHPIFQQLFLATISVYNITTEWFINVAVYNSCEMKLKENELTQFLEQVFTLRKLPIFTICSKTVREQNFSESQLMALIKIAEAPEGTFVSTIAEKMYIDTPKASRIVDSLVKAKLVKRVYDKLSDRRRIQLKATKEGADLLEKIIVESMPVMKELFEELGEKSKELTNNLETLNKLILLYQDILI